MKVSNLPPTGLKNLSRGNCRKLWESDFFPGSKRRGRKGAFELA